MTFYIGSILAPCKEACGFDGCKAYTAQLDPVLIECRPLDHIWFEGVVDLCDKLECQGLE